jgi:hypothetical protein
MIKLFYGPQHSELLYLECYDVVLEVCWVVLMFFVSYVLDMCSQQGWFVLEQHVGWPFDMGQQHGGSIRTGRLRTFR